MAKYISNYHARTLLRVLHYAYPIILLFFFLISFTLRSVILSKSAEVESKDTASPPHTPIGPNGKPLTKKKPRADKRIIKTIPLDFSRPRKLLFDWLSVLVTATFVANAVNVIFHALLEREENWWCGKSVVFYVIGSFFVYSLLLTSLLDTKPAPTSAHLASWILSVIMELILLGASLSLYTARHREPRAELGLSTGREHRGKLQENMTGWESIEILIDIIRIFILMTLILFYLILVVSRNTRLRKSTTAKADGTPNETTGLLSEPHVQETQVQSDADIEAQAEEQQQPNPGSAPDSANLKSGTAEEQAAGAPTRETQDAEAHEASTLNQDTQQLLPREASKDDKDSVRSKSSDSDESTVLDGSQIDTDKPAAAAAANTDEEEPLLSNGHAHSTDANAADTNDTAKVHAQKGYGTLKKSAVLPEGAKASLKKGSKKQEPSGWERPDSIPSRDWWEYLKGYAVLFPFLWPKKSRKLQVSVIICVLIMIAQRALNILVPTQVGTIVNILAAQNEFRTPWGPICLLIFYRLLQGGNGLLNAARTMLWLPVSQYSYLEIAVAAFEHVHSLSLDFHLGKKTGEVVSALGKGASINTFLENVTFQVLPMVVDLIVAIWYFLVAFDSYYALTISIVTFWYIYITIRMAQWRNEIRRQMVNADREEDAVKNDSMVSYETVKYFNAEQWEFQRYKNAVNKFLAAEYSVNLSLNYMNVAQNFIFMMGLLVTSFILAYQISTGQREVGKFTTLIVFMAQLQQPLNFFGTFYRVIQSAMINSERMLELFKEQPTVVDDDTALELASCTGTIDFDDVKFSYDPRKPALDGMTFHIPAGTTTAFVGESGGGKSTVFRLLFRFYNQLSGHVKVDGNDVQDITIDSLRKRIGVVPQDTVLFNETIMYNLKYANQETTEQQVYDACKAASIHHRIMEFPDGYDTKVGERGLRLSGGEKQRVAIARTILKDPRIILLDEATAALDTETEQHIQEALALLGRGRTMLVIAHRLSTITLADQIVVLHKGKVAETGTHDELLSKKGRYAGMWEKQVKAQKAAEEAKKAKDRAEQLRKEMEEASAPQSEDEAGGSRDSDSVSRPSGVAVEDSVEDSAKSRGHP